TELIEQSHTFDLLNWAISRYRNTLDYLVGSVSHVDWFQTTLISRCWIELCCSLSTPTTDCDQSINPAKPISMLINSASIRKGWSTPYPSPPILNLIISLGGKLTLSDDSHGYDRVGLLKREQI
ncbi:hypothetical protein MJO29_002523, partial [Puccinia striiformis f. sp. tritici]